MKDKRRQRRPRGNRDGAILGVVLVVVVVVSVAAAGFMSLGTADGVETSQAIGRARAFWLAEAGLQRLVKRLYNDQYEDIPETSMGLGTYEVTLHVGAGTDYAIATGRAGGQEKRIRLELTLLSAPYEEAVYGGNSSGAPWTFQLRGTGSPSRYHGGERGGKDEIFGNIYANGNVVLYGQSSVLPAPFPNSYGLNGDVEASGTVDTFDDATISGNEIEGAPVKEPPLLVAMGYESNNTHNVAQLFADAGVSSGRLPSGSELYNVLVKNPSNRHRETGSTPGDDYFFEPRNAGGGGSWKEATTPLNLGEERVYYVDGDVWIHNYSTYGFEVSGNVTIVATGDIHLSDNVKYANNESLLAMVALGRYNASGSLVSGGNIWFGDPQFGTLYNVDAFMFAANSFYYNTVANTGRAGEPTSGFIVYGNYAALNQIVVNRDWYTRENDHDPRPAAYDAAAGVWKDSLDGRELTSGEVGSLRHYQMIVKYDERIRDQGTQPPGLPKGGGTAFGGIRHWTELPVNG